MATNASATNQEPICGLGGVRPSHAINQDSTSTFRRAPRVPFTIYSQCAVNSLAPPVLFGAALPYEISQRYSALHTRCIYGWQCNQPSSHTSMLPVPVPNNDWLLKRRHRNVPSQSSFGATSASGRRSWNRHLFTCSSKRR